MNKHTLDDRGVYCRFYRGSGGMHHAQRGTGQCIGVDMVVDGSEADVVVGGPTVDVVVVDGSEEEALDNLCGILGCSSVNTIK